MSEWSGIESVALLSGGGGDPLLLAGTADPTIGLGVTAPEGSFYMRYVAGGTYVYWKSGAAATAWSQVAESGIVAREDLTAAQAQVNLTGLHGDLHGTYEIWAHMVLPDGNAQGQIQFGGSGGIDTGANYAWRLIDTVGSSNNADNQGILWSPAIAEANHYAEMIGDLRARETINGVAKPLTLQAYTNRHSNANTYNAVSRMFWYNTSSLTQVRFSLSGGVSFQAGSSFRLYRRTGVGGWI